MNTLTQHYAKILESFLSSISEEISDYHRFFLESLRGGEDGKSRMQDGESNIYSFLKEAVCAIEKELATLDEDAQTALCTLAEKLESQSYDAVFHGESVDARLDLWKVFCSELYFLQVQRTSGVIAEKKSIIESLRKTRTISIEELNPHPIVHPEKEILFTSNILLSPPLIDDVEKLNVPNHIAEKAIAIAKNETQLYWYDHPMPIGIEPSANEMIYGLQGLSEMLSFEKEKGQVAEDASIQVLLSVSVTHEGLADIAQEYLQYELDQAGEFPNLDIYIITEQTTEKISEVLGDSDSHVAQIKDVFGVNGRYGRHYSFLKAIAPLWQSAMNKKTKATFKIDLDQVFPQKELQEQSGKSTLEHFKTALWGAKARDSDGQSIELGMIAGALVNEADITDGLFTPDVKIPSEPLSEEDLLFPKGLLMSFSTRGEMMTRYTDDPSMQQEAHVDGEKLALQRVHVTGGTNGILIDALKKHRPFTPSFIGRAEDQAYLMSVYNSGATDAKLRYVHASGLIMRHDKAAFAGDAIKAAKLGTYVGDLLRSLLFSRYADILPGGMQVFKDAFGPFTSCYTSQIPITAIMSRLLVHAHTLSAEQAETIFSIATSLREEFDIEKRSEWLAQRFEEEQCAWNVFYDSLESVDDAKRAVLANILAACHMG